MVTNTAFALQLPENVLQEVHGISKNFIPDLDRAPKAPLGAEASAEPVQDAADAARGSMALGASNVIPMVAFAGSAFAGAVSIGTALGTAFSDAFSPANPQQSAQILAYARDAAHSPLTISDAPMFAVGGAAAAMADLAPGAGDAEVRAMQFRAITQIEAAIAALSGVNTDAGSAARQQLEKIRDGVFTLDKAALQNLLNNITSNSSAAYSLAATDEVLRTEVQRDKYLDEQYRAALDAIMAQSRSDMDRFNEAQAKLDKLAEEKGISTSVDGNIKELNEKIAELRKSKDPEAAEKELALQLERIALIKKQNKEREDQALEMGEKEAAKQFRDHNPVIYAQEEVQREHSIKLLAAFEQNQSRALKANHTPDDRRHEIEAETQQYNLRVQQSAANADLDSYKKYADTLKNSSKFTVAEASHADQFVPAHSAGTAKKEQYLNNEL